MGGLRAVCWGLYALSGQRFAETAASLEGLTPGEGWWAMLDSNQ